MEAIEVLIEAAMQRPQTKPEVDQILFDLNHLILGNEKIKQVDERLLPLMRIYFLHHFPQASKINADLVLTIAMSATRGVVSSAQIEGFKRHSKKEIKKELCSLIYRYLHLV